MAQRRAIYVPPDPVGFRVPGQQQNISSSFSIPLSFMTNVDSFNQPENRTRLMAGSSSEDWRLSHPYSQYGSGQEGQALARRGTPEAQGGVFTDPAMWFHDWTAPDADSFMADLGHESLDNIGYSTQESFVGPSSQHLRTGALPPPIHVQYMDELEGLARTIYCRDIMLGSGVSASIRVEQHLADTLQAMIGRGLSILQTPTTRGLSLLFALEISLDAVFQDERSNAPSLATLFQIFLGSDFKNAAAQLIQRGHCSANQIQERSDLNEIQASVIVQIVSQYNGQPLQLVVVTPKTENDFDDYDYRARVVEPPGSTQQQLPHGEKRVVVLYNDQARLLSGAGESRWFGLGPQAWDSLPQTYVDVNYVHDEDDMDIENRSLVKTAPSRHANLPLAFMSRITSEELLIFFPNHVIYWPAVAARVVSEGYSWTDITKVIKQHHSGLETKQNSISYAMRESCREFFQDQNWRLSSYTHTPPDDRPSVATFAGRLWVPRCKSKVPCFQRPWSLGKLARWYAINNVVPGAGPFQELLQLALSYPQLAFSSQSYISSTCNPPTLPDGWTHNCKPKSPAAIKPETGLLSPWTTWTNRRQRVEGSLAERDAVLAETTDPLEIIENYHHKLFGELLLWMLSKNGGRKETGELTRLVRGVHRGIGARALPGLEDENVEKTKKENGSTLPTRSTFSKRKETAIECRAKRQGISKLEAFNQVEQEMWHGREDSKPHKHRQDNRVKNGKKMLKGRCQAAQDATTGNSENNVAQNAAQFAAESLTSTASVQESSEEDLTSDPTFEPMSISEEEGDIDDLNNDHDDDSVDDDDDIDDDMDASDYEWEDDYEPWWSR